MFLHHASHGLTILLLYVDDIIVTCASHSFVNKLLEHLKAQFEIKDLGLLHFFLGIEVHRDPDGIYLCQTKYALDLLHKSNMLQAKPYSSPVTASAKLSKDDRDPLTDATLYRYIKATLDFGLRLVKTRNEHLYGFSNAN